MSETRFELTVRQVGDSPIQTVNGRDLHSGLGVGKDFSTWIKAQIERARLVEGRDYLLTQKGEQLPSGTKYRIDYHLTLDAAKHVAMLSGTDRGFEVREYFIECERKAKAPAVDPANLSRMDILRLAMDSEQRALSAEKALEEQAPVVAGMARIAQAEYSMCITNAAKALQMRPKDLFEWMHNHGWIYRRHGSTVWLAFAERLRQGVLTHKVTELSLPGGKDRIVEQALVTAKGLARLAVLLETPLPPDLARSAMEAAAIERGTLQ